MKNKIIMIYGANGYTGKLLTKHLLKQGITPLLAGRRDVVKNLGQELNCPTKVFSIEDAQEHLKEVAILVNLAGPFKKTQKSLIEACISSKTHYLDIAGETTAIQQAQAYDAAAKAAQITLLPAAGFGVVPTDIAAKMAAQLLEAPTHLTISYATVGGASRGTLKTVLKDIQKAGYILINDQYKSIMPAEKEVEVEVMGHSFRAVYNPWRADLITARTSTGIKNIETYSEFPGFVVKMMKGKLTWLRNLLLNRFLKWLPEGPSAKQLQQGQTYIEAKVKNKKGQTAVVKIKGPEAYLFTNYCLENMIKLVSANEEHYGFQTPAAFDSYWLRALKSVEIKEEVY